MKSLLATALLLSASSSFAGNLHNTGSYRVVESGYLNCRAWADGNVVTTLLEGERFYGDSFDYDNSGNPWIRVQSHGCYVRSHTRHIRPQSHHGGGSNGGGHTPAYDFYSVDYHSYQVITGGLACNPGPEPSSHPRVTYYQGESVYVDYVAYSHDDKPWFFTSRGCFVRASSRYLRGQ